MAPHDVDQISTTEKDVADGPTSQRWIIDSYSHYDVVSIIVLTKMDLEVCSHVDVHQH